MAGFSAAPPAGLDNALFVVWGGPNDLFLDPSAPTAVQAANNLSASLGTLIGLGAKHILVPSMLDLSRTPDGLAASPTEQAGLSLLSATFNSVLSTDLTALRTAHSDVQLYGFDTNAAFDSLLANAAAYGFTNTTDSCVDTGCFLTSGLADEYVFWDGVHPTTHTDQILGDMFAAAVPEPAIALQMLAGLLLVASVMALRQRAS